MREHGNKDVLLEALKHPTAKRKGVTRHDIFYFDSRSAYP